MADIICNMAANSYMFTMKSYMKELILTSM